jgi:DNA-binding MarR family transcriptional regulator
MAASSARRASKARGRRRGGGHGALPLRALQHFRLIFGSVRRFDANVRRAAGISGSVLWALSEIAQHEGTSVNRLAARMALHQTTASNIVNSLVGRRLVNRRRDRADQRVVRLEVSPAGARLLERTREPHAGLLVDALMRMEGRAIRALSGSLGRLIAEMHIRARHAEGETLLGE